MKTQPAGHWWIENLLRPVLIAAMMICLAAPIVQGLEWLVEGWDGAYFLAFAFLAGLEGILSERLLKKRQVTGWGYLASRGAEAVILLLVLKFINYIPLGLDRLWADAFKWSYAPGQFISDLDLFTGVVFVPLWAGALYVSRQASELDADEVRAVPPTDKTSTEYYLWMTQPPLVRERERALNWLGETFIWGGAVLLIASMGIYMLFPTREFSAVPTLLYFALGVALLSQARFSVTYAGWQVQGISIQPGIARRWLLWVVVFLVGVALAARLLPTEYAMGPVLAVYYLILLIAQGFMMFFALITYGLALLLSLFFPRIEPGQRPSLTMPAAPVADPPTPTSSPPWLEVLLSALFWTVFLVIVGYALIRFLRERFALLAAGEGTERTWWGRLLAWLYDLWQRWRIWRYGVQERLARRRAERTVERVMASRFPRFLSLRRLPPRELVRYFYLSTARRAAEAGRRRGPDQTPYEYEADLDREFPELEVDLSGLTDAFVAARYSAQQVRKGDAEAVKPLWQRIKAVLRQQRGSR